MLILFLLSNFCPFIFASILPRDHEGHVHFHEETPSARPNRQTGQGRNPALRQNKSADKVNDVNSRSMRYLMEGQNMNYQDMNMEGVNVDEYMNRPSETFSKPISDWETQDWIVAFIVFSLVSCFLSCLARIGCGCFNLLNCLTCYCCYHLCCGDPDTGAMNYAAADGLC